MDKQHSLELTLAFMKRGESGFGDNRVELLDGSQVDCFPKVTGGEAENDPLRSDDEERASFLAHAHYLLAHREQVLHDSRMLLCPIDFDSGMIWADPNAFMRPTLGVYLQWWAVYGGTWTDRHGREGLICKLAGSGLTGANSCTVIYPDGEVERKVWVDCFKDRCRTFVRINRAYATAKELFEHYTLQEVLNRLQTK